MKGKIAMMIIWMVLITTITVQNVNAPMYTGWWNTNWYHRVQIDVNTTQYTRYDWPIEREMNFTYLLQSLGVNEPFDINSTRVIEHNSTGHAILEMTSQFDPAPDYNESNNAVGTVIWILNGTTLIDSVRTFFIYFGTTDNTKNATNYSTGLVYSNTSEEFNINNSASEWYVDTLRGENTSGLYNVVRNVEIIASGVGERTAEYIQYANGTNNLSFDFRNNFSLTTGPVRITVEQVGLETYWNDPDNKTGEGRMIKTYKFYDFINTSMQWIRIEQNFTNIGNSTIKRNSTFGGAVLINMSTFAGSTDDNTRRSNETDPGSYAWAAEQGAFFHVGVINANESGTSNFFSKINNISGNVNYGVLGIHLNETSIDPNESIKESAVIHFKSPNGNLNIVENHSKALTNPVEITQYSPESIIVLVDGEANATVYNRGETMLITGNITYDPSLLVEYVNATLDMGTPDGGDDLTLILYDDGSNGDVAAGDDVYSNNYSFNENHSVGPWVVSVRTYGNESFLNESNVTINMTNIYNATVTIPGSYALVNDIINATLDLTNFRNDVYIPNATVSCEVNLNPVTNITDLNNGTYSINFTAPSTPGTYNLTCNATKLNNSGTGNANFTAENPTTSLSINSTLNEFNTSNITQTYSEMFNLSINFTNAGNATATQVNITIQLPENWTSSPSNESCGTINQNSFCGKNFNITVANRTYAGFYMVNFTVNWTNPNSSVYSNTTITNVTVFSNPVLNVTESLISNDVGDGLEKAVGNLTVLSIGNDNVANITFNVTGLTDFNVTFIPANISSLNEGSNQSVQVNVSVPPGQAAGNYTGNINISSDNGGWDNLTLTITVPNVTFLSLNTLPQIYNSYSVTQNNSEMFNVSLNVTNFGNATASQVNVSVQIPGNWTSSPSNESCGLVVPQSICSRLFNITIANATPPGTYIVNLTANWSNPNGSVYSNTTNVTVNVLLNPVLDVQETNITTQVGDGVEKVVGNFTILSVGNGAVGNVSFNVTNISDFNVTFVPVNISSIPEGSNRSVQVNVSVPFGYLAGNYTGTINATSEAGGFDTLDLYIEVPENRTWTMNPQYCQRAESPDEGEVCNVTVYNIGNTVMNFNITPPLGNYTSLSVTNFSVQANDSYMFTVLYNVSGAPKIFYNSTFFVSSNKTNSTPQNISLGILLIPYVLPVVTFEFVPSILAQTEYVDIFVNVSDRSLTGINNTHMNITDPNGTVYNLVMNNTNTTDNLTEWHVKFPQVNASNTSQIIGSTLWRGLYNVTVYAEDNTGANDTYPNNFTVFANFTTSLATLKSKYAQGSTGAIFYKATDSNASALYPSNVTLWIINSGGNLTYNESFTVDTNGMISPLPTFEITSDAPLGFYNLSSYSTYYDDVVNMSLNSTSLYSFEVTSTTTGGVFAEVESTVIWYPNNVMTFDMLVSNAAGAPVDPDMMVLTVYDPANNHYFTTNMSNMTQIGVGYYNYSYAMPLSTSTGPYLALLNVSQGEYNTLSIHPFIVTAGGPFDLRINLIEIEVGPGDYLDFTLDIENKGETSIDVLAEIWVTQLGTTWYYNSETILATALDTTTITRSAFIFDSQSYGIATLNAKVTFDSIQPPVTANTTFEVIQVDQLPTTPEEPSEPSVTPVPPPVEQYKLEISKWPEEISIVRGWKDVYSTQVTNNGTAELHNISVSVSGIPSLWVKTSPAVVELLTPGNSTVFIIEFEIPPTALPQEYSLILTANSHIAKDSKPMKMTVFRNQYELLLWQLKSLKEKLSKLEEDTKFAESVGKDVVKVYELIEQIKAHIAQGEDNLAASLYKEATKEIEIASNLIEVARKLLEESEITLRIETQVVPLWQIIIIIVVLVSINIFLFLWVKGIHKNLGAFIKPHLRKAAKEIKPFKEEKSIEKEVLIREKEKIIRMLKLLEREQAEGIITKEAYEELKRKGQEKLRNIERKLK
jgi:uncharacterized membrane protein